MTNKYFDLLEKIAYYFLIISIIFMASMPFGLSWVYPCVTLVFSMGSITFIWIFWEIEMALKKRKKN